MAYYNGKQLIGFKGGGGYDEGYEDGYTKGTKLIYIMMGLGGTFNGTTFPEKTDLILKVQYAPKKMDYAFCDAVNLRSVKIIAEKSQSEGANCNSAFRCPGLELVDLSECDFRPGNAQMIAFYTRSLKTILGALNFSLCTTTHLAFEYAEGLEDIEFVPNTIKINIAFKQSSKLSDKSIQSIIDGLADLTGQTSQTLTFHSTVGNKLTDTQKATITAKNWTLVY